MLADLGALISALRDVRFVAIGGVAVAAHGYIRATQDLDIVPDPEAVTFRVCAREDLLAMKRARAGAQDLADIEALTQGA